MSTRERTVQKALGCAPVLLVDAKALIIVVVDCNAVVPDLKIENRSQNKRQRHAPVNSLFRAIKRRVSVHKGAATRFCHQAPYIPMALPGIGREMPSFALPGL